MLSEKPHQCFVCQRTYERADHLQRHIKSHDNERAYKCTECGKGFNRADLLNRHRAAHDSAEHGDRSVRRRTEKACQACIRSKTKCEEERPCKRCKTRNIECIQTDERQQKRQRPSVDPTQDLGHPDYAADPDIAPPIDNDLMRIDDLDPMGFGSVFPEFFEHIMMPANDGGVNDSVVRPPDVSNYTQDLNFGVSDLDFSLLDDPAAWASVPLLQIPDVQQTTAGRTPNSEAGSRSEALKRSPWSWNHWIPPSGVGAFSEHDELNVQEDRINAADQLTSPTSRQVLHCSLEQRDRDQMIRIITKCTPLHMPSFPSLQLLEDLIDVCLLEDTYAIGSYIHTPSFDTRKTRTELLLAMVARGAAFISFGPIWQMGMVLQDVVRYAIAEEYERDNSVTRELKAVQASLMWVFTGTWSGFRRSTEIACSFLQPPITMLSWSNAFSRLAYVDIFPTLEDSSEVLDQKWRNWSEQESRKRLVFHTFLHDSQAMLVHMRPPLISPAQMHLPIPASRELWLAANAHAWRNAFLAFGIVESRTVPSTVDMLSDFESFSAREHSTDESLCRLLVVHSLAHEVFEYRQQAQMLQHAGERRRRDKSLSHMSKYRDLYDDLNAFLTLVEADPSVPPEVPFVLEFLMMLLHVSLDDIQIFAGRAGEDEARKVYPSVRSWTQDAVSRRSLWHAGQVFHHSKRFEKTRLRDFYAVALYHATLVLWVWGMVTSGTSRQSGLATPTGANSRPNQHHQPRQPSSIQAAPFGGAQTSIRVVLDSLESKAIKAFIQLGHGTPGLQDALKPPSEMPDPCSSLNAESFCSLFDSRGVMATAATVMRGNFPHTKGGLPPLVGNLASLLDDLGRLST